MTQAYISLGSAFGSKAENINRAVWLIAADKRIKVQRVSGIYEAKKHELGDALGYFAAIRIETEFSPEEVAEKLKEVEKSLGEKSISLELLMFEGVVSDSEALPLPNPKIEECPHIICPLLNLFADKRLKDRLKELGEENVKYTGAGLYLPL